MKCCKPAEWIRYIAIYLGLPSKCRYIASRLTSDIFTKECQHTSGQGVGVICAMPKSKRSFSFLPHHHLWERASSSLELMVCLNALMVGGRLPSHRTTEPTLPLPFNSIVTMILLQLPFALSCTAMKISQFSGELLSSRSVLTSHHRRSVLKMGTDPTEINGTEEEKFGQEGERVGQWIGSNWSRN